MGSSDGVHCDTCDWDTFPEACLKRSGAEAVRLPEKQKAPLWLIVLLSAIEVIAIAVGVYLSIVLRKKRVLLREKQERDEIEARRRECFQ